MRVDHWTRCPFFLSRSSFFYYFLSLIPPFFRAQRTRLAVSFSSRGGLRLDGSSFAYNVSLPAAFSTVFALRPNISNGVGYVLSTLHGVLSLGSRMLHARETFPGVVVSRRRTFTFILVICVGSGRINASCALSSLLTLGLSRGKSVCV